MPQAAYPDPETVDTASPTTPPRVHWIDTATPATPRRPLPLSLEGLRERRLQYFEACLPARAATVPIACKC